MNLYTVDYWIPWPQSEYGGLFVIAAEDVDQVVKICLDATCERRKEFKKQDMEEHIREFCTVIGTTDLFDTPCVVECFET